MKQKLLTGLQPSGNLHIGNYFGALKPFLDVYEEYESTIMVADYHALTTSKDPESMRRHIIDIVKDYIAVGVNPSHALVFQQSQVPEHTELAWIFNCLVSVPFLMQAHSYKDKVAKGLEANAGLFTYPMLMAADILLYDTDVVPTGEDQRQHIEYTREAAHKFNTLFSPLFKEPKEMILQHVGIVPGTDGKKMSKSYGNIIPLFASRDEIAKHVMSIVTDSSGDIPQNVYAIHRLFVDEITLHALYEHNRGKYKILKESLIEAIDTYFSPMREKRNEISDSDVVDLLKKGSEQARHIAQIKMHAIRNTIGISI